ncbi:MAG: hypothetical protein AB7S41_00755 [Parvibaculaceae bacterium]
MGHFLQAFVARRDLLDGGPRPTPESVLVDLRQGFAMLIEPEYDYQEIELNAAVERFGSGSSQNGSVAYVATVYHGGIGAQAAIAWADGSVLLPYRMEESQPGSSTARVIRGIRKMLRPDAPERKISPISAALKAIGVVKGEAFDEFAAVGLGECRDHEDWIHFSRTGRHEWQAVPA